MLINLSNHPSSNWSQEQIETAKRFYGDIVDLPFPNVDPAGNEEYIEALAGEYCKKVEELAAGKDVTVHLMGEMALTLALVQRLQTQGIPCVAATTKRETVEYADGRKESVFKFVRFRKYLTEATTDIEEYNN